MLYFLNIIPAVPLSLHETGVYHYVEKNLEGDYIAKKENDNRFFHSLRTTEFNLTPTDNGVYFFSAINAPALLSAPISHVWEYYDTTKNKWIESTVISFNLAGGRDDGYRAYSHKENMTEGLWRVTVKVDQKRIIGRMTFNVKKSENTVTTDVKL